MGFVDLVGLCMAEWGWGASFVGYAEETWDGVAVAVVDVGTDTVLIGCRGRTK